MGELISYRTKKYIYFTCKKLFGNVYIKYISFIIKNFHRFIASCNRYGN